MKYILAFTLFLMKTNFVPNATVEKVDLRRYCGVWYSLYSLPTMFDRNTRETTGYYSLNTKGYFDVVTTYKKGNDEEVHSVKSKVFPVANTNNAKLEAQFLWPYRVDYWIIELPEDYSYVVVGHPEYKFLFIMSRKKTMPQKQLDDIIARCKAKGYPVDKLSSQKHD